MNLVELGIAALSAVFAAGGAWVAVRVELRVLRRDVDRSHTRLDTHDLVLLEHAGRLPRET